MSEPITPQTPKKELPPEVVDNIADKLDAVLDRLIGPRDWKPIVVAVIGGITALLLLWSGYSSMISELQKNREVVVEKAKDDHAPSLDETNKLLRDGFKSLEQSFDDGFRTLAQKIDAKPKPDPKPPAPVVKLTMPESITVAIGSLSRIKADASSPVSWVLPSSEGLGADVHGDTVYVSPNRAGPFFVFAYTVNGPKINQVAVCMVLTNTAPVPPPGPQPNPSPIPSPVPLNELGKLVLAQAQKPGRKEEAAQLAAIYERVVGEIKGGKITTIGEAVKALFTANSAALGGNAVHWAGFFAWADNELTRRAEKGQLTTIQQNADAFAQIGAALREASK